MTASPPAAMLTRRPEACCPRHPLANSSPRKRRFQLSHQSDKSLNKISKTIESQPYSVPLLAPLRNRLKFKRLILLLKKAVSRVNLQLKARFMPIKFLFKRAKDSLNPFLMNQSQFIWWNFPEKSDRPMISSSEARFCRFRPILACVNFTTQKCSKKICHRFGQSVIRDFSN